MIKPATIHPSLSQRFEQATCTSVLNIVFLATSLFAKNIGDPGFTASCRAGDEDVFTVADVVTIQQFPHLLGFQPS
ncbi:Uncharacterised protein [Escherichia coli]|nr:Uncharacterised protein [Escherichia coli]